MRKSSDNSLNPRTLMPLSVARRSQPAVDFRAGDGGGFRRRRDQPVYPLVQFLVVAVALRH